MTDPRSFPRVQILPEVGRASLRIDGVERAGYEFGQGQSRPFVYPLIGPSGTPMTRMGHPNPVGHEHHKSVWFGYHKVNGIDFWADPVQGDTQIRHRRVVSYQDGSAWGAMTAELEWWSR